MAHSILLQQVTDTSKFLQQKGTLGAGHVVLVDSAGAAIYSIPMVGDVAHDAADSGNPVKIGGKAATSAPTAVTNGDRVNAYFDTNGRLVTLIDSALPAGTNAIGKLSANSGVDIGDVDVTSLPALAAGTAIIGKVGIDQTTPGTTNGVQVLTALPAGTNAIGKLSANSGVDIGDVDVLTLPGVAGDIAHDAADSGNPVKVGGKASNDAPTAVAAADRANLWVDLHGRTMTRLPGEWSATQDSAANASQTLTKALEASKRHYVTGFDVGISGAAAGADITITLKDGTTAKWKTVIGNAAAVGTRVLWGFTGGLEMTAATAVNLEVTAGGASVVTHANLSGFTANA